MGTSKFKKFAIALNIIFCCAAYSADEPRYHSVLPSIEASKESSDLSYFLPKDGHYVNWIFSGAVTNAKGEQFGYFFQIERVDNHLRSNAALFDAETKKILFQDQNEGEYHSLSPYHWQVGRSFLNFNPINASWVFGLKTENKQGFNFKIDMLAQNQPPLEENLRPGLSVLINQANALNGHIKVNSHEQFVTAQHAWFRQISVESLENTSHLVSGVLCHFDDNSGFYSMKLPEVDALRGSLAGRFDAEGTPAMMSQFIHIKQREDGPWDIIIPSPHYHLVLSDYLQQNTMIAGFVKHDQSLGFCLLSDETIG